MKDKKSKKSLYIKISVVLVLVMISLLIIVFSPKIINRLRGNTISINSLNENKNTGVIITNDLLLNKSDNQINLKVYNGSGKEITVSKYIYKQYDASASYTEVNIDPVIIANDKDGIITIDNASSLFSEFSSDRDVAISKIDVGILYSLDNENYTLNTSSLSFSEFNVDNINTDETYSKTITSSLFEIVSSDANANKIDISLSKNKVVLDISENLSKAGLTYGVSSTGNFLFENPQSSNSLTKNIFGKANTSNIDEYFNYNGESDSLTTSGSFVLSGSPKKLASNEVITPGLYFTQSNETNNFSSDLETPFSGTLPSFTLTIYDKTELKEAIVNAYEKMYAADEENVDIDSFNAYSDILLSASDMYYSRYEYKTTSKETKEITQEEINSVVNSLNNAQIAKKQSADYISLNAVIVKVNNLNESYYNSEDIASIKALVALKEDGLTVNYQPKVDNLTTKINVAYNALEMLPADWSSVDSALTEAAAYTTNKVPNTSTQLYTTESWNALTNAKTEANKPANRNKKINEQETINGYATAILTAIENLEKLPADYSNIDSFIEYYNMIKYNNWFEPDKTAAIEEYLEGIDRTKKIDEQSYVDEVLAKLEEMAIDAIKIADGVYKEPYYEKMQGKSFEAFYEYIKNAVPDNYVEEEMISNMKSLKCIISKELYVIVDGKRYEVSPTYSDCSDASYTNDSGEVIYIDDFEYEYMSFEEFLSMMFESKEDYSIINQAQVDGILTELYYMIDMLVLKDGNYTELCKYYSDAINLNKEFYENYDVITDALWDLSWDYKIDNQGKIDEQATKLKNALDSLILKKADTTNLEKIYSVAASLNENNYLNFSGVKSVMKEYESIKNATIDKQAKVNEVAKKLSSEISKLQLKEADYSNIEVLKSKISQLDASKYLNYTTVTEALGNIIYGKKIDEQESVNKMYTDLKLAYDSLIKKSDNIADYSKLRTYLSNIPADYSSYSKELQEEIKSVLNDVRSLSTNLTSDKQSEIDALTQRVVDLLIKLEIDIYDTESSAIVLSYLKVNGNKVDITTVPFKYTASYDTLEAKIDVGLSSKDSSSKVYGGGVILPGENIITIQVTSKDGTIYNYKLIINRKATSDYLSDLAIKNSAIEFNKTKQEYTIKVDKNTDKLDLSAITEDENAIVKIKGNENLKNGSKVTIEVISADGSVRVYTLDVQKAGSVDVKVIIVLILVLAFLAGVFKIIQNKKKENNI